MNEDEEAGLKMNEEEEQLTYSVQRSSLLRIEKRKQMKLKVK
jgi:hypothetical protein